MCLFKIFNHVENMFLHLRIPHSFYWDIYLVFLLIMQEVSLLQGCKRTVTVICKEEVEVLFVNKEASINEDSLKVHYTPYRCTRSSVVIWPYDQCIIYILHDVFNYHRHCICCITFATPAWGGGGQVYVPTTSPIFSWRVIPVLFSIKNRISIELLGIPWNGKGRNWYHSVERTIYN